MWVHLAFLFLAGTALVDSALWEPNHEYQYLVRSRALTGARVTQQVSGVLMKGNLVIHVATPDILMVDFINTEYASVHTALPAGWEAHIPDQKLNYVSVSLLNDPLKVTLRNGKINEVLAQPNTPVSAVNLMKGILSQLQLQIDLAQTQRKPYQMYTTREQTVSGYCDTIYDITPVSHQKLRKANLPLVNQAEQDGYLEIAKYKDFKNCVQAPKYRFGIMNEMNRNVEEDYIMRSSSTNMIASYKNELFTIRSSSTKNVVQVRPKLNDMETSKMFSMMNLTLVKMEKTTKNIQIPSNSVSTGNLSFHSNLEDTNLWTESNLLDLEALRSKESLERSRESDESAESYVSARNKRFIHSENSEDKSDDKSESNSREFGYFSRRYKLNEDMQSRNLYQMDNSRSSHLPDMMKEINLLINDIALNILTPDEILKQHTLEKFTILTNMLRHMNETSLATVEDLVRVTHKPTKQDEKKIIAQKVFRDAVAQTGTVSALKIIRTWILSKKIKDLEASLLIGRLPRAARQLTPRYIDEFFKFINLPEVKNQVFLNNTAPYAFSEIVRYALVWDQSSLSFTNKLRFTEEDKRKVTNTYIPYLANELEKAYEKKHNSQIVTYIIALGNIAHPNIIRVFEPYLEGKRSLTTFQRTTMVGALSRLNVENKELVRPIVYRIYQNEKERYEVRVMAINVLFKSNPPLHILQRMAEKTYTENCPQVNNAVVTGIDSLTKLKGRKYQEVVKNAQIAMKLTNPDYEHAVKYSTNQMRDYVNKEKDSYSWFFANTIGSKTSIMPKTVNLEFGINSSSVSPPALKIQAATSDARSMMQFVKLWWRWLVKNVGQVKQSTIDELTEKLNIVQHSEETLEGSYFMNNEYGVQLIVIDEQTLENLLRSIMRTSETGTFDYNKNNVVNQMSNWELTVSYPTEIGIPVTYRLKTPQLISFRNKIRASGQSADQINLQANSDIDLVLTRKVISRISFETPFNNEQHFAGVDVDRQLRVPAALNVQLNTKDKRVKIEYKPLPGSNLVKIWQRNVTPYTGSIDTPTFKTIHSSKNTQPIIVGKVKTNVMRFGKFVLKREVDHFKPRRNNDQETSMNQDALGSIMKVVYSSPLHFLKEELRRNYNSEEDNSVTISFNYDVISSKDGERALHANKLLREMQEKSQIKGNNVLNKFDVRVQIPSNNIDYQCDGGIVKSKERSVGEMRVNCDLNSGSSSQWNGKICVQAEVSNPRSSCPSIDLSSEKVRQFKASVRYGKEQCTNDQEITIQAIQKQSEDVKQEIKNSKLYEQSMKEIAEGNMGMINSQRLCKVIDFMDEFELSVQMDPKEVETVNQLIMKSLTNKLFRDANIDFVKPSRQHSTSNMINLNIKRQLYSDKVNVAMVSPPLNIHIPIDLSILPETTKKELDASWGIKNLNNFCSLGKNKIKTFNNVVYPVKVDKCTRVLMINPTKIRSNSNLDSQLSTMSNKKEVAIMVAELENQRKELIITHMNNVLKFKLSQDGNQLLLNEKEVQFADHETAYIYNKDIKIQQYHRHLYKIAIEPAEVIVWLNREGVIIQASDEFNGNVRGLCGTKNGNQNQDLMAPQGCIVTKPEHMSALYTLNDDKCHEDETIRRERQEAEQSECDSVQHEQTDVVSDFETERDLEQPMDHTTMQKCSTVQTLVKTDIEGFQNRICFSTRPVPTCKSNCVSEVTVLKPVDYHCYRPSPEIEELKKKIEKGANPDFSTKTVHKTIAMRVPSRCRPKQFSGLFQ